MEKFKPTISVLIASYNHENFIEETIKSIWSQPYKHVEIIVVDDCSVDSSPDILKRLAQQSPLPMRLLLNKKNIGVAATLNLALEISQGEFIAILGSDDKFAPERFSKQLALFQHNPELKFVFGNGRILQHNKLGKKVHRGQVEFLLTLEPHKILNQLYTNKIALFLQCALIRTSFVKAIGGYDETMLADDWVLNVKMFQNITSRREFAYIDEDIVYYRVHESNSFKNFDRHRRLKLQFVEKYTPKQLKAAAYSNIHFNIAKSALRAQLYKQAWKHYWVSQVTKFELGQIRFLVKFFYKLMFDRLFVRTGANIISGKSIQD
jgi:alpha-1,3-rhamnosyltransferase